MLTVDSAMLTAFRDYLPEFSDTSVWPDAELTRHLEDAISETNTNRWGEFVTAPVSFRARGIFNYAAHRAVIAKAARKAVENGGTPAAPSQATSKQVGDESVQYAVQPAESNAQAQAIGDLSSTLYGQEFLRLRKRAGTGAATTGVRHLPGGVA